MRTIYYHYIMRAYNVLAIVRADVIQPPHHETPFNSDTNDIVSTTRLDVFTINLSRARETVNDFVINHVPSGPAIIVDKVLLPREHRSTATITNTLPLLYRTL